MARNRDSEDPNPGSMLDDLKILGGGILGVVVGLALAGMMLAAGVFSGRLVLVAVAAFFIGATAAVYGGLMVLLRICLPGLHSETRQIVTIASVLVLIIAVIVVAFRTDGFQNL